MAKNQFLNWEKCQICNLTKKTHWFIWFHEFKFTFTGDVILQANGKGVKDPEQLQTVIEESGEFVVFKIQPSNIDPVDIENALPKAGKVAKVEAKNYIT